MQSPKSLLAFALFSSIAFGLSGCGGGNGGSADNPSPFMGTYAGTISDPHGSIQARWTVNAAGYITGSDTNGGVVGVDSGFVDLNGALKVTSRATGSPNILYAANVTLTGQSGDMVGNGTESSSGQTQAITLDLLFQ